MGTIQLRDYQVAAVNAAMQAINAQQRELIVMPTGSGKSLVLAAIVERLLGREIRTRVLIVTSSREIITQDADVLAQHLPGVDFGVYCAGLDRFEPGKNVVIASIQSFYRRTYSRGFDVILVDEAHLIPPSDRSMYRQLFMFLERRGGSAEYKSRPDNLHMRLPIIGFSATPYRLDTGYLHKGEGAMFSRIAYDAPIPPLINQGFLASLTTREVVEIDFSDLPVKSTDYDVKAYEETHRDWLGETARSLAITRRLAANREHWLVFCCSVRHAVAVTDMLAAEGISSKIVHHKLGKSDRRQAISSFREGPTRALVTVNCLLVGFDAPNIDCIVCLRPTLSAGLHFQMLGRGMRPFPGKKDCLILDFAGNRRRHGSFTDPLPQIVAPIAKRNKFDGENRPLGAPPEKLCPQCAKVLMSHARQCSNCGRLFFNLDHAPVAYDPIYESDEEAKQEPEELTEATHHADGYPSYLAKIHHKYHYTRRVPAHMMHMVGTRRWIYSLKTGDRAKALVLARRLATRHDRWIKYAKDHWKPPPPPPSDYPLMGTEEVAEAIGVTKRYARQMRHYGTGPAWYNSGGSTQYGWRQIVYRQEDVIAWRQGKTYIEAKPGSKSGKVWRLGPEAFLPPKERQQRWKELREERDNDKQQR